jgi:hypothetical protein
MKEALTNPAKTMAQYKEYEALLIRDRKSIDTVSGYEDMG